MRPGAEVEDPVQDVQEVQMHLKFNRAQTSIKHAQRSGDSREMSLSLDWLCDRGVFKRGEKHPLIRAHHIAAV